MTFEEWTTEARRSLEAWNPEPAVRPTAVTARPQPGDVAAADAVTTSVDLDLSPVHGRQPAPMRRRLLSAVAAAAVVAAAAATAMAISSADTDVAVGPQAEPTQPAAPEPSDPVEPADTVDPSDPAPDPDAPRFDCSVVDRENGAPTTVFDDPTIVADWRVDDPPFAPPTSASVTDVRGTLVASPGEDVAGTAARASTFVAALAPDWMCTVWSPEIDVADPTRPGPIVDENDVVTNRLGGMCYVPDASARADSVWGIDPSLATALGQVDGLTDWTVILADGGRNGQGADRLWMEFSFEADPSSGDDGSAARVLADVSAAVDTAGAAAGVPTECAVH